MKSDLKKILFERQAIEKRVVELGKQISHDYANEELLVICILKGSVIFFSDLIRALDIPVKIDFLRVSSYGSGVCSSEKVKVSGTLPENFTGSKILLVEDIVDSGLTLKFLLEYFMERGASDIKVCTMLDKPDRRRVSVSPDYIGFTVPDEFVVGYGMDFDQKYRNLPYIAILKDACYLKLETIQ